MILVLFIPFAIAVGLGIVHQAPDPKAKLVGLMTAYTATKELTVRTLDDVDKARREGAIGPNELTTLLGQVSELAHEVMSYYVERREQSTRTGVNADDVPAIFLLLAGTRAL